MRTWETALKIVSPVKRSPLFLGVVLEDLEERLVVLQQKRLGGRLTKTEEQDLRVGLIKKYFLNKQISKLVRH